MQNVSTRAAAAAAAAAADDQSRPSVVNGHLPSSLCDAPVSVCDGHGDSSATAGSYTSFQSS